MSSPLSLTDKLGALICKRINHLPCLHVHACTQPHPPLLRTHNVKCTHRRSVFTLRHLLWCDPAHWFSLWHSLSTKGLSRLMCWSHPLKQHILPIDVYIHFSFVDQWFMQLTFFFWQSLLKRDNAHSLYNRVTLNYTNLCWIHFCLAFKRADVPLTSSRWSGDSLGKKKKKPAPMQKAAPAHNRWRNRARSKNSRREVNTEFTSSSTWEETE